MRAIARHHVGVDPQHLERMRAICRRLGSPRRGLTEKNRTRFRAFDDPSNAVALLQLPRKLMELARRGRHPYRAAVLAQLAVAVEILLMAPIRISNLASLDVERHLVRPSRKSARLHIVLAAEEVKNREPLDYPLLPQSAELIKEYLADFRPKLAGSEGTALFPGRSGGAKAVNALRLQIIGVVHAHTGLRMNPHLFRHVGAKLFLDANPGAHEVVRRVLGHRSIETTMCFCAGLETAAAVRHFDETILRLRQAGASS